MKPKEGIEREVLETIMKVLDEADKINKEGTFGHGVREVLRAAVQRLLKKK